MKTNNLVEHLKNLISMFGSRNEDSVPIAAMAEAWNALPKLLAVVKAAKRTSESQIVKNAPFTNYSEALSDLRDALAALEET